MKCFGASHQTGWTGIVARLIQVAGYLEKQIIPEGYTRPGMMNYRRSHPECNP